MPQIQLPIFPDGVTELTADLAVQKENGKVTYFNGCMPVFSHDENDLATFRMITSQFCVNGHVKQAEISRAFGVSLLSMKRAVKKYREQGPKGFYAPRRTRGAVVLTAEVIEKAQALLSDGKSHSEVAAEVQVKSNTLAKAIRAGRLKKNTP